MDYGKIRFVACDSSSIQVFGYSNEEKTLVINFVKGNTVYEFYDVPYYIFVRMYKATSVGKFFNEEIQGKFSSDKVSD